MFRLNIQAYNFRYNLEEEQDYYKFEFIEGKQNPYQVLMSLNCWLYQCCEGDINKDNLWQAMKKIKYCLCETIINQTEEYNKCKWG